MYTWVFYLTEISKTIKMRRITLQISLINTKLLHPSQHNLNLVAFWGILIYVHVSQPGKFEIIFCRQQFNSTTFYDSYTVLLQGPCISTNNVV